MTTQMEAVYIYRLHLRDGKMLKTRYILWTFVVAVLFFSGSYSSTSEKSTNLVDPKSGNSAWGLTDPENNVITLNFKSVTIGDVALTILHEVSHVVLGCKDQDKEHHYIYGIEYKYMVALREITMMTHIEATNPLIMVQLVPRIKEGLQVLLELKR